MKNKKYIIFMSILAIYIIAYAYIDIPNTINDNKIAKQIIVDDNNNGMAQLSELVKSNLNVDYNNVLKKCIKNNCDISKLEKYSDIEKYILEMNKIVGNINSYSQFSKDDTYNINGFASYVEGSNYFASNYGDKNISKSIFNNNYNIGLNLLYSFSGLSVKYIGLSIYEDTIKYIDNNLDRTIDKLNTDTILLEYARFEYNQALDYIEEDSLFNVIFIPKTQYLKYKKYKLLSIIENKNTEIIVDNNWYLLLNRKYLYNKVGGDIPSFQNFKNRLMKIK